MCLWPLFPSLYLSSFLLPNLTLSFLALLIRWQNWGGAPESVMKHRTRRAWVWLVGRFFIQRGNSNSFFPSEPFYFLWAFPQTQPHQLLAGNTSITDQCKKKTSIFFQLSLPLEPPVRRNAIRSLMIPNISTASTGKIFPVFGSGRKSSKIFPLETTISCCLVPEKLPWMALWIAEARWRVRAYKCILSPKDCNGE